MEFTETLCLSGLLVWTQTPSSGPGRTQGCLYEPGSGVGGVGTLEPRHHSRFVSKVFLGLFYPCDCCVRGHEDGEGPSVDGVVLQNDYTTKVVWVVGVTDIVFINSDRVFISGCFIGSLPKTLKSRNPLLLI